MRRPNPEKLQAQCEAFNAKYPVGQPVTVRRDNGEVLSTVTRSKAEVLSGHSAVIWLEGISGCYLLDRVTPATGKVSCSCFGDSGLHASTYVPVGSDKEHCDLCGLPVPDGSLDVISAVNAAPKATA